jgi:hypothetical protein
MGAEVEVEGEPIHSSVLALTALYILLFPYLFARFRPGRSNCKGLCMALIQILLFQNHHGVV